MARISKSQLEKLQKKYPTDDAIGSLFGITRQAIHQLRTKYGIPPVENKTLDRNNEIFEEYKKGVAGTKLAKKHKLSISQTYRIINEYNNSMSRATKKGPAKKVSSKKPVKKVVKKKSSK